MLLRVKEVLSYGLDLGWTLRMTCVVCTLAPKYLHGSSKRDTCTCLDPPGFTAGLMCPGFADAM